MSTIRIRILVFDLNNLPQFIAVGLFLDVFIFHHFRKEGDMFDTPDKHKKGTIAQYVNCCLCHGFGIGCVIVPFFPNYNTYDIFLGGAIMAISSLTYRILVLKE